MIDKPEKADSNPAPKPSGNSGEADHPAAGPHAKPGLTDDERTPGAGTLADTDEENVGDGASS